MFTYKKKRRMIYIDRQGTGHETLFSQINWNKKGSDI